MWHRMEFTGNLVVEIFIWILLCMVLVWRGLIYLHVEDSDMNWNTSEMPQLLAGGEVIGTSLLFFSKFVMKQESWDAD